MSGNCPKCGLDLPRADTKVCPECGYSLSSRVAPPPVPQPAPNPGVTIKPKKRPSVLMGCLGFFVLMVILSAIFGGGSDKPKHRPSPATPVSPIVRAEPKPAAPEPIKAAKASSQEAPQSKNRRLGETFKIGYTTYQARRFAWYRQLGQNEYVRKTANAMFLVIEVAVRNDDTQARVIPPFKLVDENGAEYEADAAASIYIDNGLGLIEPLNPGVSKQGLIVFDTLQTHKYKLKCSGGYWSGEDCLVNLN